jgi:methionyl-tRNA synthetase
VSFNNPFFQPLFDEGRFKEEVSNQFYDEKNDQFLADRYITGTCPKCQHPAAYGDQCENCGSALSPLELINPKSTISGETPVLKETKHWYLPMNDYEKWLKEWIVEGHKDDWKSNVYGQCKSWLDGGLLPRAMTRDLEWGVKVPIEGAGGKVLYVWLDAPIGYISATKAWAKDKGKNWKDYWQNEETELVHFIGKDNIVFHCIIFPIILKAHGNYILPTNVPANEFLNLEGAKISTSRNHAVWLHEFMEELPEYKDTLRYVLCSIAPESKDSEFTWKDFQARHNNELVAILGNFVNRVLVLMDKYYEGKVPQVDFNPEDKEYYDLSEAIESIETNIKKFRFRDALNSAMMIARIGNKYLAEKEPWKLMKTDPQRVEQIMAASVHIMANLSVALEPFLPDTAQKLKECLGLDSELKWDVLFDDSFGKNILKTTNNGLLFNKLEDDVIQKQIDKLNVEEEVKGNPLKPEIQFEDFTKLDIRVGKILSAEKVAKADKLLKLEVDTGVDKRTVVSGIAKHYEPEEIIGKHVTILLNLAPRKIRGVESQGMILMAENDENKLSFVSPTEGFIDEGSEIH